MATPQQSTPRAAADTSRVSRLESPAVRHALAFALAVVVPVLLRFVTPPSAPGDGVLAFLSVTIGFCLVAAGLLIYVWWQHTAWVNRDGEIWNERWMLGQGPTAFSRHPGWLAVMAMVLGQALISPSILLAGFALLVIIVLNLIVRRHDEPLLARQHGDEYEAYRARVARWLPWRNVANTLREMGQMLRNSVR